MSSIADCHPPPSTFEIYFKIKLWQSPSASAAVNSPSCKHSHRTIILLANSWSSKTSMCHAMSPLTAPPGGNSGVSVPISRMLKVTLIVLIFCCRSSDGAGGRDAVRRGRVDGSRAHLRPRGRKPGPAYGGPLAPRRRPDPGRRREHQADPAQSDPGPERELHLQGAQHGGMEQGLGPAIPGHTL
ncbi:hypothetical protein AVEN_119543-1 [Araneus ventricosus]|uniref:Uncharacterized protein n=1 Tax=Araneus ventricosus TaxID=182803 RepID=A0A4Y2JEL7_ARAVE|nr:hypothetical protein AVEN_119543-1 [Araneus ventricosus]